MWPAPMLSTIANGKKGRLQGKAAIITGAARGIGRATAIAFARAGADVMGIDIAAPVSETLDVALLRRTNWRKPVQFWKWRRTIPAFAKKFVSASALRPNSCLSTCPNSGHSCVDDRSESRREHFLNHSTRERRAPALWRRGEV